MQRDLTYDDALARIREGVRSREDIMCTPNDMRPTLDDDGNFVLEYRDGRKFRPTDHALKQAAQRSDGIPTGFIKYITNPRVKPNGTIDHERDEGDNETLCVVFNNAWRYMDSDKVFRFRTYNDNTMRAMLTERYAIVDNEWYLRLIRKLIPDGVIKRWYGDQDNIHADILLPDTMVRKTDSEYGGMFHIGNSEIGSLRVMQAASVWRQICTNGMMGWAAEEGGVRKKHIGNIDLNDLANQIRANLEKQVKELPKGIDILLQSQNHEFNGHKPQELLAVIGRENNLSTSQLRDIAGEYGNHESTHRNLFGLVNAITRAGQGMKASDTFELDKLGGQLASMTDQQWTRLTNRAANLTEKEFNKAWGIKSSKSVAV